MSRVIRDPKANTWLFTYTIYSACANGSAIPGVTQSPLNRRDSVACPLLIVNELTVDSLSSLREQLDEREKHIGHMCTMSVRRST